MFFLAKPKMASIVEYDLHIQPTNLISLSRYLVTKMCRHFVSRIMLHLKVTTFNYNRQVMTTCSEQKTRLIQLINLTEDMFRIPIDTSNSIMEILEVAILIIDSEQTVSETFKTDLMVDSLKSVPILSLTSLLRDLIIGSFMQFQRIELSSVIEIKLVDSYIAEVNQILNAITDSILLLPNMRRFPPNFTQIATHKFKIHYVWTEW